MFRSTSFGAVALAAILVASNAFAGDIATPGPAPLSPLVTKGPHGFASYIAGGCGPYFGINGMGSAAGLAGTGTPGANPVVGQGAFGGTLGYGCPIGVTPGNFWFVEGNFDYAFNQVSGAAGVSMSSSGAHFEQRVGLGSPISSMLSMFGGGAPTGSLNVPNIPPLPNGITAGPVYPFLFGSIHEQDVSFANGLTANREWLISPGLGIGVQTRLSNAVVAEVAAQWVMQSSGVQLGPVQKVNYSNGALASFTLKY